MHQSTMTAQPDTSRDPWVLLFPLSLAGFVMIGAMLTSLSVYGAGMQAVFGWSETELGAGPVALLLGMSIGNLLVGPAMQRLGVRGTFAGGCALAAAGWLGAGSITTLGQFALTMGIAGLGAGIATIVPGIALLTSTFHKRPRLAIALFIASCSLAATTMPIVTGHLIEGAGWRGAFRMVAGAAACLVPLLFLLLPAALPTADADTPADEGHDGGLTRPAALRLPAFWLLTAVLTISQLCMNGVMFNTIAFLGKHGVEQGTAIQLYSLTNFMSLPGLLVGGHLSDRVSARKMLSVIIGLQAIGTLALLGAGLDSVAGLATIIAFVCLWGGVAGLPAQSGSLLLAELVGRRSYGTLLGIVFTINGFLGAGAPGLTGWLHDLGGGYSLPFTLFTAMLLVTALACLLIVPSPARQPVQ